MMLKEFLLGIYRFINPKAFQFEHLAQIAGGLLDSSKSNQLLSGIYTTGLYSSVMFLEQVKSPIDENVHPLKTQVDSGMNVGGDQVSIESESTEKPMIEKKTDDLVLETITESQQKDAIQQDNSTVNETSDGKIDETPEYFHDEEIFKEIVEPTELKVTPEEISMPFTEPAVFWEEVTDPLIDVVEAPSSEPQIFKKEKPKKKKKKTSKLKSRKESKKNSAFQPSDFSKWVSDLASISENSSRKLEVKKKKKKKGKKKLSKVELSAQQSIILTSDIASETLASILASQGHTMEAIDMYKKLITIHPDKKKEISLKIDELEN